MQRERRDQGFSPSTESAFTEPDFMARRREFFSPLQETTTSSVQSEAKTRIEDDDPEVAKSESFSAEAASALLGTNVEGKSNPNVTAGSSPPQESWPALFSKNIDAHFENLPVVVLIVAGVVGVFYLMTQDNDSQQLNSLSGIAWLSVKALFVVAILGLASIPLAYARRRESGSIQSEAVIAGVTGGSAALTAFVLSLLLWSLGADSLEADKSSSATEPETSQSPTDKLLHQRSEVGAR